MSTLKHLIMAVLAAFAFTSPAFTQDAGESKSSGPEAGEPARFESTGKVTVNGRTINYDVIAGETFLLDDKDQPNAAIFSFSYIKKDVQDPTTRPVVFIFNGGPGSASLWLHMGVFGPKRVDVATDGPTDDGAPPYPVIDNAYSLIDVADLVFIDPVGTGYSRVLEDGKGSEHWGVEQDARSVGTFIRIWLTENKRWNSPK